MPKRRKRPPKYTNHTPEAPRVPDLDPEAAPYLDFQAGMPGWPGYRNRPRRSGLDYLDNQFEWAHMQGVLLRQLFTGKLRTRNPIYLMMMGFCGLVYNSAVLFVLVSIIALLGFAASLSFLDIIVLLILLLLSIIISAPGIALLVNLYKNLFL